MTRNANAPIFALLLLSLACVTASAADAPCDPSAFARAAKTVPRLAVRHNGRVKPLSAFVAEVAPYLPPTPSRSLANAS